MTSIEIQRFLLGCAIGDGCISKSKSHGICTLHIQRKLAHYEYAEWQLNRLNSCLGTKANLKVFNDKGKYPCVRFGVTSKKILSPVYSLLYPNGLKVISARVLETLTLEELALFWMDDGSLEVRKRVKPTGSTKIERIAWLAVCENEQTANEVNLWIHHLTGATGRNVRHKSGKYYLRWHSQQCKMLVNAIDKYILPCLKYKTDLSRTGSVSEWLSKSKLQNNEVDDKVTQVPCTQQLALTQERVMI